METPFRKIIQISSSEYQIDALCNDGTVWSKRDGGKWKRIDDIPNE